MENSENILVVIAARGGSKGVKNKNIRDLGGKPLIAHTIELAKRWNRADRIICSTDSDMIAEVARKYGAEIPFKRPSHLAGDDVGKVPVIRHAALEAEKAYKKDYGIVVDLDATSPIRKNTDLDNCLELFKNKRPKTLLSVVHSRKNPYFNMLEEREDGRVDFCKKIEKDLLTRQGSPRVYDANASIYFYRRDYLMDERNKTVISDDTIAYVMDDLSAFDIDTEMDFRFVEFLIKERIWNI